MSLNLSTSHSRVGDHSNEFTSTGPLLAFLGPAGTYSHQAAHDRFAESVHYQPRNTISDVFDSVGTSAQLGLLPQENSIFGSVMETYDTLRSSDVGKSKWIRGTATLSIEHCLVVRQGKTMRDIKTVLSHEQGLGQCRRFLATHLPTARLVSVASTAAAAEVVSTQADDVADGAAICSKICLRLFANLEMLREGIQDEHDNFTRFYVLANDASSPLPNAWHDGSGERNALIRLEALPESESQSSSPPTISGLLAALGLPAARIDRRPSTTVSRERFRSVYFVEVVDVMRSDGSRPSSQHSAKVGRSASLSPWKERVVAAVARAVESGGRADLLGTW
ncbi:PDT-domain-containing protein [Russula earlei]|uniref:PDT-domain-containing protein n=1 Tax=Russula earlei TaxID=71964 RepID=A0ACC0UN10_9AGAM|nr:PDT-domain-containing protein [Russula earlei]